MFKVILKVVPDSAGSSDLVCVGQNISLRVICCILCLCCKARALMLYRNWLSEGEGQIGRADASVLVSLKSSR